MTGYDDYITIKVAPAVRNGAVPRYIIPPAEIVDFFSNSHTKNSILEGFLEFGNRCFLNTAVFSVYSHSIQFLKGSGANIRKSGHLGGINIDQNTVIRRAIVSKFPYCGAIPTGSDEKVVFSKFFNRFAEEIFLYPGSIGGGDTDILFYGDTFEADRDASLATFEYLIDKTTLALKLLFVQRRLLAI